MKSKENSFYPLTKSVLEKKDLSAAVKVINSGNITMGSKTLEIENYFKKKVTGINSLMVNSGSSANLLIFQCLINPLVKRLKAGDEVLSSNMLVYIFMAYNSKRLKVKFVDISLETLNIDIN